MYFFLFFLLFLRLYTLALHVVVLSDFRFPFPNLPKKTEGMLNQNYILTVAQTYGRTGVVIII